MTKKLQKSVEKIVSTDEKKISGILGVAKGGQELVDVPSRLGYVYVRLRSNQNEVIQAINNVISPIYNLPVLLERRGNKWTIVSKDTGKYDRWETTSSFLPKHGNQHSVSREFGIGADPVWVFPDQIMPLLVYPSGSLGSNNLFVAPYVLKTASKFVYVGNTGTPNIVQHRPNGTGSYVGMVFLDTTTGNPGIIIVSGTTVYGEISSVSQIVNYLPYPEAYQIPLYGFTLSSGTTRLGWDNLFNVRQFLDRDTTGTSGGTSVHNSLTGIQGGSTGSYFHLSQSEYINTISGSSTSAHNSLTGIQGGATGSYFHLSQSQYMNAISGSTASDIVFNVDGELALTTGASMPYLVVRTIDIPNWYIHAEYKGLPTGTTIVDINVLRTGSQSSIFTTQSNRPMLVYNATHGWAMSGAPDITRFLAGDILTLDVDQIATGTERLVVNGRGEVPGGGGGLTPQPSFAVTTLAGDQALTTIADITGMAFTKILEAGVYYRWTVSLYVIKTTTSTLRLSIVDENNISVVDRPQTMVTGYGYTYTFSFCEIGQGIQVTRKLRGYCDSGSAVIYAGINMSQFMFERMT